MNNISKQARFEKPAHCSRRPTLIDGDEFDRRPSSYAPRTCSLASRHSRAFLRNLATSADEVSKRVVR